MTNIQKLTESGLARELKVSRQAVHDLVKREILSKDSAGLIDVEMAKIALANRVRPSGKTATNLVETKASAADKESTDETGATGTSYHVAKTLREAAEAQIACMKLAEMKGQLIRVEAVKSALGSVFSTTRDALLQIPARLSALLAAESDPATVQNMLHTEIHQALQHLAGSADRIGVIKEEAE